jgi:hypothetical protein
MRDHSSRVIRGFRPVLRMYEPAPEVLNQTYTVPPITRS